MAVQSPYVFHPPCTSVPARFDVLGLAAKGLNVVDRWDGITYRRVIVAGNRLVEVAVRQNGQELKVEAGRLTKYERSTVTAALERLLGLHVDLRQFYWFAAADSRLGPLVTAQNDNVLFAQSRNVLLTASRLGRCEKDNYS